MYTKRSPNTHITNWKALCHLIPFCGTFSEAYYTTGIHIEMTQENGHINIHRAHYTHFSLLEFWFDQVDLMRINITALMLSPAKFHVRRMIIEIEKRVLWTKQSDSNPKPSSALNIVYIHVKSTAALVFGDPWTAPCGFSAMSIAHYSVRQAYNIQYAPLQSRKCITRHRRGSQASSMCCVCMLCCTANTSRSSAPNSMFAQQ